MSTIYSERLFAVSHALGIHNGWTVTCRYGLPDLTASASSLEEVMDGAIVLTLLERLLLKVDIIDKNSRTPLRIR